LPSGIGFSPVHRERPRGKGRPAKDRTTRLRQVARLGVRGAGLVSAWLIALIVYAAGCVIATWLLSRVFSLASRYDEDDRELVPRLHQRLHQKVKRAREDELVTR
jgi:hypothetical protein